MADLAGERLVEVTELPAGPTVDGTPVREAGQLLQMVALGRAVTVVPSSVQRRLARDLVGVPVLDAPSVALHVAWPRHSTSRAVAAFVRAATAAACASA